MHYNHTSYTHVPTFFGLEYQKPEEYMLKYTTPTFRINYIFMIFMMHNDEFIEDPMYVQFLQHKSL